MGPPTWRLGVVLAAGTLLALATTRLSPHVAPSIAILAVAAIVATAPGFLPEKPWPAILATVIAGLAAAHVLFRPGLPQVHDDLHVWGMWAYARAAQAGDWLPMWIPDLGAGMPLLQFYGPINFLAIVPGVLLHAVPVTLWKEAMVQSGILAMLATLLGARLLGANWRGALVATIAMGFAPWRLALVNFRGAVGEATALIFAPLVAAAVLASGRRAAWVLGASLALLIPTHLITGFCLAIVLVPALILQRFAAREEPVAKRLAALAIPSLLAAGLVAIWLVPALAEGKYTSLRMQTETHAYFVYDQHGLGPSDLFVRRAWDTSRPSLLASDRAAGMEGQQMPFYVGAILFAAALTAPWWSRSRATWAPAAGAAAGVLFATAPAAALMTHLPAIHKIQFPWRFLTPATILACYAVALGVSALEGKARRIALLLPALLICDAAPYTGAAGWVAPYHGVTHWVRAEGSTGREPFDTVMRPVVQEWPRSGDALRVVDLYLPPDDTTTPIALFWVPYPEWMTPPLYRAALAARNSRDFAEFGVVRYFLQGREQGAVIHPKPLASVHELDAGPVTCTPGRIALRPTAPEGGAPLIVREQWFPGWEATVDGRRAALTATPIGFMQIELPGGAHDVVLAYTRGTPARRAGLVISVLALAATVIVVGRSKAWGGQAPSRF